MYLLHTHSSPDSFRRACRCKTALHYTVRNGDTDTPSTYLDNMGLDPNICDAGG